MHSKNNDNDNGDDIATIFQHQVAGHFKESMLQCGGKVFKPCIKRDAFLREVQVYERFMTSKHADKWKEFTSIYYGTQTQSLLDYLVLEDLTAGYNQPSVCDFKVGLRTYEPTATPDKIESQSTKFRFQKQLGFRVSGAKVFNVITQQYEIYDKLYGRNLNPATICESVACLFHDGRKFRDEVLQRYVQQLQYLSALMETQTEFHFYSASLLFLYEADCENCYVGKEKQAQVKLIDFAHTLVDQNSMDDNFVQGLQLLIKTFQQILT